MSLNLSLKCLIFLLLIIPVVSGAGFIIIIDEQALQKIEHDWGLQGRERVVLWTQLMDEDRSLANEHIGQKLMHTNDYFNQVRWLSDLEHWGVDDYWATPVETLATNGGDCEDYSIGKYFSLIASNVDNEKLRITYVKSLTYNQAHMVLAYYEEPDSEPLILDNINKTILPASQRSDLVPVYSFSGDSIWLAKARSKKLNVSSETGLPRWKQVNDRLRDQLELRVLP